MPSVPETYFSRRIRESQDAMMAAPDSCARIAHAQLEAAYRVLASAAEPLLAAPSFHYAFVEADAPCPVLFGRAG